MSGVEQGVPPIASPTAEPDPFDLGAYARERMRALRAGELGSLPVILGLVLIVAFFQYRNDNFISPGNLVNLMRQMAGLTIIAIGVVFVLLLGEIDLSVGYVSGVCGSIAALLLLQDGSWELPGIVAIAIAVGFPFEPVTRNEDAAGTCACLSGGPSRVPQPVGIDDRRPVAVCPQVKLGEFSQRHQSDSGGEATIEPPASIRIPPSDRLAGGIDIEVA